MKKKEAVEKTAKKIRAKYNCPPMLEELIEFVNLVPLNIEMRSAEKNFNEYKNNNEFVSYLRTLPKKFNDYLNESVSRLCQKQILEPSSEYSPQLTDTHKQILEDAYKNGVLKGLYVSFYEQRKSAMNFIAGVNRLQRGEPIGDLNNELMIMTAVDLIKIGGKVKANLTGFASVIGKFEAERLRVCEICNRLFWAKRRESKTCSAKCYNNYRQRLYRHLTDEEKVERKNRRNANRKVNNKLKKIREKKNGTL